MGIGDLTQPQKEVWDCRHAENPPKPMEDVAKELGISPTAAKNRYLLAREKMGLVGAVGRISQRTETKDPGTVAALYDEFTTPNGRSLARIAEDLDLPYALARQLIKRLEREYVALERPMGDVRRTELRDLFAHNAHRILTRITEKDIEKANLRDKLIAAAIGTDKFQLLDGQPTEIFSIKELENLDALAGLLHQELQRRQLSATTEPETLDVTIHKEEEAR